MKIAVSTRSFAEYDEGPLNYLREKAGEAAVNPLGRKPNEEELIALLEGAVGLIAGTEAISRKAMEASPALKVISRAGVGVDKVDLEAARELGIDVLITPEAPTQPVAELTIALMLDCLRHVSRLDREIRRGVWKPRMGALLRGKTVGVLGFGRIGRRVAKLLAPFEPTLLACDEAPDADALEKAGAEAVSLHELLQKADILTIHLPLLPETKGLISRERLETMKEGAILVNVSRGGIVDDSALCAALRSGRIAAAGLDVFEKEPAGGELLELESAVLTSHVGSYAVEARIEMEWEAARNLIGALEKRGILNS